MLRRSAVAPRPLVALIVGLALVAASAATGAPLPGTATVRDRDVVASIGSDSIVLRNAAVERRWSRAPFATTQIVDRRSGLTTGAGSDFRLALADGAALDGDDFTVRSATARVLERGGVALRLVLAHPLGTVTRTVSAFPGVAGFETRTELALAGALVGYDLERIALPGAAPALHAFAAGYDWRGSDTPDWEPAAAPFGGAHTGDHRETTTGPPGEALEGEGQWLSLADPADRRAFLVSQRVDYASTRMGYDGVTGAARVDLAHDVVYLGPFEADVHAGAPARTPARTRLLRPDAPLALETVFTGFALDGDDEAWQHHRYLTGHRQPPFRRDVVFNSNGVDDNRISTGAKDDMDLDEVVRQAAIAKRMGVEVFVLDDGWQAISGDWCPDSPQCPEPRGRWAPRFPDAEFAAVREAIAPLRLGLWMSPMHFNPATELDERNPGWVCQPVGGALAAYNTVEPDSSSNEAGLGTWNPLGTGPDGRLVDYVEARIRHAITAWEVAYFKFDFLAWIDCAGADGVSAYEYREAFVAMLDRLVADHPEVTFQVDETNDYRLFPFESAARGPSWYANGSPRVREALHNLWVLAPYVPGATIGQGAYGRDRGQRDADELMAAALGSHVTFFNDLRELSADEIAAAARWMRVYKAHRETLSGFAYPLLSDPIDGGWTALQPWNPDEQRGAVLVFRQDDPAPSTTVALRGVRGEGAYRITDAATGAPLRTASAAQLRAGIPVALGAGEAAVWLIDALDDGPFPAPR